MKIKKYENEIFSELYFEDEEIEGYNFLECTFIDCNFSMCTIIDMRFSNCKFERCNISTLQVQTHSELINSEFINCRLSGITWQDLLPKSNFLEPIKKFDNCSLKYNVFNKYNFRKFDFSENEIIDSTFSECQLVESKFKNANLDRTEFIKSNLSKADFRYSTNYIIDIMSCNLKNAKFSFPEVVNLLKSLDINIE